MKKSSLNTITIDVIEVIEAYRTLSYSELLLIRIVI
ncbi:hypothetical protein F940_00814 [Acinetobacter radioresistens NIPH 2130]|jgi:hypothetical protein|nr:hypothetical protein F940_00814 [Acinetobacter radioresistens NIPH 2130]